MHTLLLAVVLALLFGVSLETRFRVPRSIHGWLMRLQIGRVRLDVVIYRPRRAYAHVVVGL